MDDLPEQFLDELNIDEVTKIRMRLSNPDIQPARMADLRMKNLKLLTKKSQRYFGVFGVSNCSLTCRL